MLSYVVPFDVHTGSSIDGQSSEHTQWASWGPNVLHTPKDGQCIFKHGSKSGNKRIPDSYDIQCQGNFSQIKYHSQPKSVSLNTEAPFPFLGAKLRNPRQRNEIQEEL